MRTRESPASPLLDLHCHSEASDGTLSPGQVVARASNYGVRVLALTDHDTIAGIDEAAAVASTLGMVFIAGAEFSCLWRGQTIHVVGLDFNHQDPDLIQAVGAQEEVRRNRAITIDERLRGLGLPSVLADARALAAGVPGRPHFARALLERRIVSRIDSAFSRYLGTGRAGDVSACWPEVARVVGWIQAAGGVAVLAHPRKYRLTNTKLRALVSDFSASGGRSLEVLSSGQSPQDAEYLTRLCREFSCWASGGSDFHQPGRHWCELGRLPTLPKGAEPVWHHFRTATRAAINRLPELVPQGE